MLPSPPGSRSRAWSVIAVLCLVQLAASLLGSLRADDWFNLERGAIAWTPAGAAEVWTTLNRFGLYRPLVDFWHGGMLRLFGLHAPPMMAVLIGVLLLQSVLLARLVRVRGGSRETAALAAAAVWAQPNAYSWTTLWVSNVTGSLMVLASLVVLLLHARAIRRLGRGEGAGLTLAAMCAVMLAGALCKEEIVLLPALVVALEAARWPWRSPSERRASIAATGALVALAGAYAAFRLVILPTPQTGSHRYHLRLGGHVLRNIAFFSAHLAALPAVVLLWTRWRHPSALASYAWHSDLGRQERREVLAGLAWAGIVSLIYLPISGRPSYGYLLAPAFGIAYATGWFLTGVSRIAAAPEPRAMPVRLLATYAAVATLVCAAALASVGWHRYGRLQEAMAATLREASGELPAGAHLVFVDAGERETPAGRTLFDLMVTSDPSAFVRVVLARPDLSAETVVAPGTTDATAAADRPGRPFLAREGRLQALPPATRAGSGTSL